MAKKTREKEKDVDFYRHETERRKNAVTVGLAFYDTSPSKQSDCDLHLDPQLRWSGKKEHIPLEVSTVAYDLKLSSDRAIL